MGLHKDASVTDLAFRAYQPLGQGRLGEEKSSRNFRSGKPAERTQGQADLRFRVKSGVATSENEPQPILGKVHLSAGACPLTDGGGRDFGVS